MRKKTELIKISVKMNVCVCVCAAHTLCIIIKVNATSNFKITHTNFC